MNKNEEIRQLIIKSFRESGMSYTELARIAGTSDRIISYWVNGARVPRDIGTVDKVLTALGISVTLGKE